MFKLYFFSFLGSYFSIVLSPFKPSELIDKFCSMSSIRDWFEDELRAFQGGKDGIMPCVWENEPSSFPQVVTAFNLILFSTI